MATTFSRTFHSNRDADQYLRRMGLKYVGADELNPHRESWADSKDQPGTARTRATVFRKRYNHILVSGTIDLPPNLTAEKKL